MLIVSQRRFLHRDGINLPYLKALSLHYLRLSKRITFVALAIAFAVMPANAAAETLQLSGIKLSPVLLSDATAGVVSKQIALVGDAPEATYVVVQFAGGGVLMRDRAGLFQPWDRDPAHLADNGFVPQTGNLRFKVLDQNLDGFSFPMRVTLYYRANGQLKFGYFDVFRSN